MVSSSGTGPDMPFEWTEEADPMPKEKPAFPNPLMQKAIDSMPKDVACYKCGGSGAKKKADGGVKRCNKCAGNGRFG